MEVSTRYPIFSLTCVCALLGMMHSACYFSVTLAWPLVLFLCSCQSISLPPYSSLGSDEHGICALPGSPGTAILRDSSVNSKALECALEGSVAF